jgi:hypothetical protein
MDFSHLVVAALTGVTIVLLVWVEIRSRRNNAAQEQPPTVPVPEEVRPVSRKKR